MEKKTGCISRNAIALVVAFVEATILGGSIFGWPSLVYVLQDYGLYRGLCEPTSANNITDQNPSHANSHESSTFHLRLVPSSRTESKEEFTGRCLAQKVQLSDAYTAAIISYGVCALPVGLFFDRFGLRATRTIIILIGVAANLLLAFVTPGLEWMIMLAAICLGIGCYGIFMTVCHLALLGGRKAATVLGIYMAGLDTAFAYTAVKILTDNGISHVYSLLSLASIWALAIVPTWTVLPKFKVSMHEEVEVDQSKNLNSNRSSRNYNSSNADDSAIYTDYNPSDSSYQLPSDKTTGLKPKSTDNKKNEETSSKLERSGRTRLTGIFFSVEFALFVFWFCANHVRINMMNNAFDAWLSDVVGGDMKKVSFYTNWLAYGSILTILPSPFIGYVTDAMTAKYGHLAGGKELSLVPMAVATSVVNILLSVFLFMNSELAIWAAIFVYGLSKLVLYSTASSLTVLLYPTEHFGIIYGVTYLMGGLASLMMTPYFAWISASGSFTPVNWLMMGTLIFSLTLPVKLYTTWWRHWRSRKPERQPLLHGGCKA